ncbi:MAG: thioredoxin fold domain-containing protein [Chromatiaceae bacterium]|nr:thioredoxin fold domain-containing protein [Chromatiaceae bacterium]
MPSPEEAQLRTSTHGRRLRILTTPALGLWPLLLCAALILILNTGRVAGAEDDYSFDDSPRAEAMEHPAWFKRSLLDLREDLKEAVQAGKQGLMVYFGQARCAYCHRLLQVNFGLDDIATYARNHFDLVALDARGPREVTLLNGDVMTEQDFALVEETNFTPSILFYDRDGREALRLRGYYPPYQFRAALEYVADGHYARESFRDYLARGDDRRVFDAEDLNEEDFFAPPPFNLDRSQRPGERPLVVFFEQGDCHGCDVLHGQLLRDGTLRGLVQGLDSVQLDMRAATPVVTPSGERTQARDWAATLGLFHAPTLIFFDEQGQEILRLDSLARFYRLGQVLSYITSGAYRYQRYPQWRAQGSAD